MSTMAWIVIGALLVWILTPIIWLSFSSDSTKGRTDYINNHTYGEDEPFLIEKNDDEWDGTNE